MKMSLLLLAGSFLLVSCASSYEEPMPTSPIQWQARQERIQREEDQRQQLCAMAKPDDPRRAQLCNTQPNPERP